MEDSQLKKSIYHVQNSINPIQFKPSQHRLKIRNKNVSKNIGTAYKPSSSDRQD